MSKDRIKEEQLLEESLNQSYTLGISTGLDIACVLVSKRAQTAFVRNRDEGEIYHLTRKDSNFAIVGGTKYWKRVCLLCFKCEDTITPRIAEEKRDQEAHTKREKLTETLWKKYGEKR